MESITETTLDKQQRIDIFGLFHWNSPEEFEFQTAEKKMLRRLAIYVKAVIDDDEKGSYSYFTNKKSRGPKRGRKPVARNTVGNLFHSNVNNSDNSDDVEAVDFTKTEIDLKRVLFEKAKKILTSLKLIGDESYGEHYFNENMVSVKVSNANTFGQVACIHCNEKKKVYYDATNWTMSNFKQHIKTCKMRGLFPNIDTNSDVMVKKAHSESPKNANKINETQPNEIFVQEEMQHIEYSKADEEIDTSTTTLNVSNDVLCVFDKDEHQIYFRICHQLNKLRPIVLNNGETEKSFAVNFGEVEKSIKICEIASNGDCLFASLAHQLYLSRIGSVNHKNQTLELRKQLVELMKENFDYYEQALKGEVVFRLTDDHEKTEDEITKLAKNRLFDELPFPGSWGGTETLLATSHLHKVNVMVISKDNFQVVGEFNFDYERCLIVCFRSIARNSEENHYDSVTYIEPELLYNCMQAIKKKLLPKIN